MKKITLPLIVSLFIFVACGSARGADPLKPDDPKKPDTVAVVEYSFNPQSVDALKIKTNGNLKPGEVVYLEDGVYNNLQIIFAGEGTPTEPITLAARNPGRAVITGAINLKIGGRWLVMSGLNFKDGYAHGGDLVEFRSQTTTLAYNCRLTNCSIDNCNNTLIDKNSTSQTERWVMLYGRDNVVDHCYFANKDRNGVLMMVSLDNPESRNNHHIIEYNYFGDREQFAPGNGAETIRLGDSKTSIYSCQTTVRKNYFYHCDGEVEIISIKSADNLVSCNTFYESAGSVVCRHGRGNTIESNLFIGNNKSNCGGVRLINAGHKVYNNYFQDLAGTTTRSALCIMNGIFENPTPETDTEREPLNSYHRVRDAQVLFNTFVNCKSVEIGTIGSYTYAGSYRTGEKIFATLTPENVTIANNIIYNTNDTQPWKNLTSSAVAGVSFINNLYLFKSDFVVSGFVKIPLVYTEQTNKPYLCGITSGINSVGDYPFVTLDISGHSRTTPKDAGAQQLSNLSWGFNTPSPQDCGVSWSR